jgi:hypothetical protein
MEGPFQGPLLYTLIAFAVFALLDVTQTFLLNVDDLGHLMVRKIQEDERQEFVNMHPRVFMFLYMYEKLYMMVGAAIIIAISVTAIVLTQGGIRWIYAGFIFHQIGVLFWNRWEENRRWNTANNLMEDTASLATPEERQDPDQLRRELILSDITIEIGERAACWRPLHVRWPFWLIKFPRLAIWVFLAFAIRPFVMG